MILVRFADLGIPIVSRLISLQAGHWSNHCDLLTEDEMMISAMPFSGVSERSNLSLAAERTDYIPVYCSTEQRAAALEFARAQVGKPYDYAGVFSFGWGAHWQDKKRWFCSELTAAALAHAGIIVAPKAHRVSPGELYRLLQQGNAL